MNSERTQKNWNRKKKWAKDKNRVWDTNCKQMNVNSFEPFHIYGAPDAEWHAERNLENKVARMLQDQKLFVQTVT